MRFPEEAAMNGFTEYAGSIQYATTWSGDYSDLTVEVVAAVDPSLVQIGGQVGGQVGGWTLDLMQVRELIDQLQRAEAVARRNGDKM
jgi:hypothetical protein